jgi:WD40 repeat protein
VVSASDDGTARVWSVATAASLLTIRVPGGARVLSARFAPSGELVTLGDDAAVRRWDATTGRAIAARVFRDTPQDLQFDRAGTRAASPVANRAATVWDVATGLTLHELVGHVGATNSAEWSGDGSLILTAAMDGTARVWDATSGDQLAVFEHGQQVAAAGFSPDQHAIITSSSDGTAAIWSLPRWTGSAADLEAILRCRVPYEVRDGRLVSIVRDDSKCRQ